LKARIAGRHAANLWCEAEITADESVLDNTQPEVSLRK
jgi:hypothetical protein